MISHQHDTVEHFLFKGAQAEVALRKEMELCEILPEVRVGAEVYFFRGISDTQVLRELAIDGTEFILVEMPHGTWTDAMYRELELIHSKHGLTPIIAHVDRYLGRLRTFGIPENLAELPVLVQANTGFFQKYSTQAMRMLNRDQIHLLGSDCHNLSTRFPNLGETVDNIRKKLGEHALLRIMKYQEVVLK